MHSAGLELTKLTYTRLEDNLIRHRGDRPHAGSSPELLTPANRDYLCMTDVQRPTLGLFWLIGLRVIGLRVRDGHSCFDHACEHRCRLTDPSPILEGSSGEGGSLGMARPADHVWKISKSRGSIRVGSGRIGPDRVGPDRVGPDRVGPDRVGPDRVGPDRVGPDRVGPDRVGPDWVGPDRVRRFSIITSRAAPP